MHQLSVSLVCLLTLLTLAGCGPKNPTTVPVTGLVTQGGEPVEGATVTLTRGGGGLAGGELAIGKTDATGHFELITHFGPQASAQGAVPGDYEVVISKHVPPPGYTQAQYDALVAAANKIGETGAQVPKDKQPPQLVEKFPERFSMRGKSQLKANIPEKGPVELSFKLD
ncbi:MAG: carboxypeptidase-like regulatory domain-containing protein [Planctomycetes bacterium]|nr:carboxypeptidase-like regulatory domain-containing protein [Planctomycetota bacterium]